MIPNEGVIKSTGARSSYVSASLINELHNPSIHSVMKKTKIYILEIRYATREFTCLIKNTRDGSFFRVTKSEIPRYSKNS